MYDVGPCPGFVHTDPVFKLRSPKTLLQRSHLPTNPDNLIDIMLNIILDCGALSNPANGAVDTSSGVTYGEQASYSCDTGYGLLGNSQTSCQATGNWETAPTCQIVSKHNY